LDSKPRDRRPREEVERARTSADGNAARAGRKPSTFWASRTSARGPGREIPAEVPDDAPADTGQAARGEDRVAATSASASSSPRTVARQRGQGLLRLPRAAEQPAYPPGVRTQVARHWLHALRRRSQRDRMSWERMRELSGRWLPMPGFCISGPSSVSASGPKARARCVGSARWELGGGGPLRAVPTATVAWASRQSRPWTKVGGAPHSCMRARRPYLRFRSQRSSMMRTALRPNGEVLPHSAFLARGFRTKSLTPENASSLAGRPLPNGQSALPLKKSLDVALDFLATRCRRRHMHADLPVQRSNRGQ